MTTITPELRQAIEQAGSEPARLVDPTTNVTYLLVNQADYLVLPIDWSGELTPEEQTGLLRDIGTRVGWDDPEMDVYDDLDPRASS